MVYICTGLTHPYIVHNCKNSPHAFFNLLSPRERVPHSQAYTGPPFIVVLSVGPCEHQMWAMYNMASLAVYAPRSQDVCILVHFINYEYFHTVYGRK